MKSLCIFFIIATQIYTASDCQSYQNAKEILNAVATRYLSHEGLEIEFNIAVQLTNKPERKESGRIIQLNEMFRIETGEQDIYCNGRSLWYYLKAANEVQINDYEGDESGEMGIVSPKDLLRQYKSGLFEFAFVKKTKKNAHETVEIQFKPTDEFSDYSKLLITIDKTLHSIVRIKAFGKDDSIYTMNVKKEQFAISYPEEYFIFDPDKFPGIYIEDLRIN